MISFAKKFMSIALAAVLILGVLPATAFAASYHANVYYGKVPGDGQYVNAVDSGVDTTVFAETDNLDQGDLAAYIPAPDALPLGQAFSHWTMGDGTVCDGSDACKMTAERNVVAVTKSVAPVTVFIYKNTYTGNSADAIGSFQVNPNATITSAMVAANAPAYAGETMDPASITFGDGSALPGTVPTDRNVVVKYTVDHVHTWNDWVVTLAPTTTATGVETRTCTGCGATENRVIPMLPTVDTSKTYTVTFNTNATDVTNPGAITVNHNGPYNNLPVVSRVGYNFLGWYYAGSKVENNSTIAVNGNHTLDAQWEAKYYNVEFKNGAGATFKTLSVKHGEVMSGTPSPNEAGAVAGKYPIGWSVDVTKPVTSNLTVTPVYKNATYTITFDPDFKGGETKYKDIVFGSFCGDLPVPSRNRYVFKGWYLDGTQVTKDTIYNWDHNITLKAKWVEEARVKLMIYRNGKTSSAYDEVQLYGYGVGDTIYTKNINIKDYYKNGDKSFQFSGWYDREGWTYFKAGDKASPIESVKTVGLDGTTVLFCMITDSNASSNKTPDSSNPKTGDESMIFATTAVMLVSAGALAVYFMDRKRRNG